MDSNFSEVYGSISLKLCMKKVKQIFDIIQNGGLAAIFDVNTLGVITWRTSPGFRSNLVQRDCIGGATCMPLHFLFSFKCGDRVAIFAFLPLILRFNPTKRSWYRPVIFCSSSNCFNLTNFYTFSAELYRPTGLLF